jgi:hypothetical protein
MAGEGCTGDNGKRRELKNNSPLGPPGTAALVAAVLCTLLVKGGWLVLTQCHTATRRPPVAFRPAFSQAFWVKRGRPFA